MSKSALVVVLVMLVLLQLVGYWLAFNIIHPLTIVSAITASVLVVLMEIVVLVVLKACDVLIKNNQFKW